jgi:hypothetical protein
MKDSLDDFDGMNAEDSAIALFSYGAFIHRTDENPDDLDL